MPRPIGFWGGVTSNLFATFGAEVYIVKIMLWVAGLGAATYDVLLGIIPPGPANFFDNICFYFRQAVLTFHAWYAYFSQHYCSLRGGCWHLDIDNLGAIGVLRNCRLRHSHGRRLSEIC
jgi:hypothetical protein